MNKKSVWALVVLVLVIVVFALVATKRSDVEEEIEQEDQTEEVEGAETVRIDALYAFENGTYTVAGEINLPTPCDLLNTDVEVSNDEKEAVLHFTIVNESEGDELCAQVTTKNPFKESFEAQEDAELSATFEGEEAVLNLIPTTNQDLENFEIFIKG